MRKLSEDISSGNFQQFYLLYGQESYLKRQYRKRLTDAMLPGGDRMNYAYYEGRQLPVGEIIDLAETLPFFAERRLIVIENSGWFKTANDRINDYMTHVPETTFFLFVESEVDKRGKLYKLISKNGYCVSMDRQKPAQLEKWVSGRCRKLGFSITRPALDRFLVMTGDEMDNIDNELQKLTAYCHGRDVIRPEDVEAVCCSQVPDEIFTMTDAISDRNAKKALDAYSSLLERREEPLRILAMLVRQFNILLRIRSLMDDGISGSAMASYISLHPYVLKKSREQARRFRQATLLSALKDCGQTEQDIKTGLLPDRMGVEMLIIKYSRDASRAI